MPKLDICIETVFTEILFEDRIPKIVAHGFEALEFWFWDYEFDGVGLKPKKKDINRIAALTKNSNLVITDIVVNSPDGSIGGFLTKPQDKAAYLGRLRETIDVAHLLGCKKIITCTGNAIEGVSREKQKQSIIDTLTEACQITEKEGIILLLEPLNTIVDHPGYFLFSSKEGFDIVRNVNSPNLRLLYDVYHMQIMEGNVTATIRENIHLIGHFHGAGVPGRGELNRGELNYRYILDEIDVSEYNGYFGLEYFPKIGSEESLRQMASYLQK